MNFIQKLRKIQRKNNSLLCIGLDTDPRKAPKSLHRGADLHFEFNRCIIEATKDIVCAYKLNLAFYESEFGWSTVHKTLDCIPREIVTIADGKRADIANTAEQYAHQIFDEWEFTAATVNPYMGKDSIEPFIKHRDRCAFILAVTSNPGARDFQYLKVSGRPLYEHVVARAKKWNTKGNIGLVAGATKPEELKRIRAIAPEMPLLIPGVGAQKADLESTVRFGCDGRGELAVINVGRSIIYASSGKDFAEQARAAALRYRDQMNEYRIKYLK